jgi:hypothetical protein
MAAVDAHMLTAEFIRRATRVVAEARAAATLLGPHERSWALLERAARMECFVFDVEAELDAILASGRVA